MKLFIDSEFTGLHQRTTLISIGIVSEDKRTFYAEFLDYDRTQVNEWIYKNVIQKLQFKEPKFGVEGNYYLASRTDDNPVGEDLYKSYSVELQGNTDEVTKELLMWLSQFDQVEFWSDCLSYAWVLLNQLWGGALNVPDNVYYIPFDICTMFKLFGVDPDINREEFAEMTTLSDRKHTAIHDAWVIFHCYKRLCKDLRRLSEDIPSDLCAKHGMDDCSLCRE